MNPEGAHPAVELRGLTKGFGEVIANSGVDLRVKAGAIHAIIGENGAGKSTAMKMLYGIYRPDAGEIRVEGKGRIWSSPADAIAAGIGMVHQHFMLAEPFTVLENILLGVEPPLIKRRWLHRALTPVNWRNARTRLEALSKRYGLGVDIDARVEALPVGVQQRVEILKLLYRESRILILDEPTAVLTPQETTELFSQLRKLSSEGRTVLVITHKLKEVMAVADDVTVFRAGRVVGDRRVKETDPDELAYLMVGRKVKSEISRSNLKKDLPPALDVKNLSLKASDGGKDSLTDVSFQVRGGEIVGIAGVEGNGQSELIQCLVHPRELRGRVSGQIWFKGEVVLSAGRAVSTSTMKSLGLGVIPEDRHRQGLVLGWSLLDNFLLGLQRRREFQWHGWIRSKEVKAAGTRAVGLFDVRPASVEGRMQGLSGGNQQKVIIAREFEAKPRFLVAAQPTRGVDIGAIEFIHRKILEARDEGVGILLISSELDEIRALSDRILVMYEGRVAAELDREGATERKLGLLMGGGRLP